VQLSSFTQSAGQEVGLAYQSLQLQSLLLQGPDALSQLVQQQRQAAEAAEAATAATTDTIATEATTTTLATAETAQAATSSYADRAKAPKEGKVKFASASGDADRSSTREGDKRETSKGSGSRIKGADASTSGATEETQRVGMRARALSYVADPYFGGVILDLRGNPGGLLTSAVRDKEDYI